MEDNYQDFENWFNVFYARHGGSKPGNLKRWFNEVEKSHQDIRGFLGGVKKQSFFKLNSQQKPLSKEEAIPIIREILSLVPSYLECYGYSEDIFLLPTIKQGTHSEFKVPKHIRYYATNHIKIPFNDIKRLDKALSSLGELWSRARTSNIELETTISTSARAFSLLGHYGPDTDSCFRNGSDKTLDKFCLGQTKNTFVLTIAKKNEKDVYKNVARCFGFSDPHFGVLNFSNYYASSKFLEGDGIETIRMVLNDLWKTTDYDFIEDRSLIDGVYHNPYGRWSFIKKNHYPNYTLNANINMLKHFICVRCDKDQGAERGWQEVDDEYICNRCANSAKICEISGKFTFKTLIEVLVNKKIFNAHPDIANQYRKCNYCQTPTDILLTDDQICVDCYDTNYTNCDNCLKDIKIDEIISCDFEDICVNCVNEGHLPYDDEIIDVISNASIVE